MGRESREVWTKRVERWHDSGLSAKEFASEVGVNANRLQTWGWRLAAERRRTERPAGRKAEALQWVEVAAPTKESKPAPTPPRPGEPGEKLELVLANGHLVRVPARLEAEVLRRLLAVVG
jgi:transposase